jgi:hypothetical protein
MSKYLARLATAAILATGIFVGGSGPATAAPASQHHQQIVSVNFSDTGW